MTSQVEVVDLRNAIGSSPSRLAAPLETLDGRRILLFDNGKIINPVIKHFAGIFDALRAHIELCFPQAAVTVLSRDILTGDAKRVDTVLDEVLASSPDAVIMGLLDQGVTQPSMLMATRLERGGIPTSLICQGSGSRLAASIAELCIPGVPMTSIPIQRADLGAKVLAEAERIAGAVVAGLMQRAAGNGGSTAAKRDQRLHLSDSDTSAEYSQLMSSAGIGDGLPMVAPTPSRVSAMLDAVKLSAETEIWPTIAPRANPLRAIDVAAVAVAAGCVPEWFGVVLAAYRAMAAPEFRLSQAAITTHPGGTLVLVSGPLADKLGIASGPGCIGPGFPANATIGRAVALAASVFLGSRAGKSDLSTLASPAKYSYCFAEDLKNSPWPGINSDLYDSETSCVTVFKCEGTRTVLDDTSSRPEDLLDAFCDALTGIGCNTAFNPRSETPVILNPMHAGIVARSGWTRKNVQDYLFEHARNDAEALKNRGSSINRPDWFQGLPRYPIVESPDDFKIVVAGDVGPHSAVALPWGSCRAATRKIES